MDYKKKTESNENDTFTNDELTFIRQRRSNFGDDETMTDQELVDWYRQPFEESDSEPDEHRATTQSEDEPEPPHNIDDGVQWVNTAYMNTGSMIEVSNRFHEVQDPRVLRVVMIKRYRDIKQSLDVAVRSSLDNNGHYYDQESEVLYMRLHDIPRVFYRLNRAIADISEETFRTYDRYCVITDTYPLPTHVNFLPYENYRDSIERFVSKIVKYLVCKPEMPVLENNRVPTEITDLPRHQVSVSRGKRRITSSTALEILEILTKKQLTYNELYIRVKQTHPRYNKSNCSSDLSNLVKRGYLTRIKTFIGASPGQRSNVFVYSISMENRIKINSEY